MKPKILLIISTLILSVSYGIRAQTLISGTVRDKETNEKLPGTSIVIKGTNTGTVTDANGDFSFSVPSLNTQLLVSFIGYENQEVALNGRAQVNILLSQSASIMEDVVVVGYGTKKVVNLTGSISQVSNEDINWKQVGQTSMALQGVSPGVTVTQSS